MALPELTKIVIPSRVDELARETPEHVWFSVPNDSNDTTKGFRDIGFAQGARAVNRLCEYFEARIGRGDGSRRVACVTASLDPRPVFLCLALVKLGHVGLWSAPRNTVAMHLNLFDKTGCDTLL